jgi:periplasmic glucans biosynthesis protein
VRRRDFIQVVGTIALVTSLPALKRGRAAQPGVGSAPAIAFAAADVQKYARELAAKPFVPAQSDLPKAWQQLRADQYRDIRFKREQAVWASEGGPFQVDLLHRGYLFKEPVTIYVVVDGQARRLLYAPDLFTFGPSVQLPPDATITDFSGFRLRAPLNRPDYFDECVVFQGASYFRAVAKGQIYGLSARGVAISTAAPNGEEFPVFRTFWIERPRPEASVIVVHAFLDSKSTTGAYRFTIRPGDPTVIDVEMTLYPRVELSQIGLAPLTSMFFFGPNDRIGIDDFRPAVHDSEGLAIWNGREEWLWRPLLNPKTLQISAFIDATPRGFGLLQRHRAFAAYEDLDAYYERRPSLWVEAIGDWGQGAVQLVEIPSKSEDNDNIVAFWRPTQPIPAQAEYRFTYRLHWCWAPPVVPAEAVTAATRVGAGPEKGTRRFVIDFIGGRLAALKEDTAVAPMLVTSAGTIKDVVAQPNSATGGWRISFVLAPGNATLCELRCTLKRGEELLSETWSYRWIL